MIVLGLFKGRKEASTELLEKMRLKENTVGAVMALLAKNWDLEAGNTLIISAVVDYNQETQRIERSQWLLTGALEKKIFGAEPQEISG